MKYNIEDRVKKIALKLSDGKYKVYGHEIRMKCPRSDDIRRHPKHDSSPSFFINILTGEYHCFGCGLSGGYKKLLKLAGMEYYPEIEEIEEKLNKKTENKEIRKIIDMPENRLPCWIEIDGKLEVVNEYLKNRKVPAKILKELDIQISKSYGILKDAILYPIKYKDMSFYGARITDVNYIKNTPYFYPKDSPKERVLYRIDTWYRDYDSIILVEGIFDYMRMLSYGYRFTVPLFGKVLSDYQIKDLINMKIKKMYLMLDKDATEDAIEIGIKNMRLFDIYVCKLKSKDPDEASIDEIDNSINNPVHIVNFL